jgi:hypothetical protein
VRFGAGLKSPAAGLPASSGPTPQPALKPPQPKPSAPNRPLAPTSSPRSNRRNSNLGRLREKGWPLINADERRLKTNLSALICVYLRPEMSFSTSCLA